ncbi:TetR/AcrR family transcriptional regulator [Nocardia inohanensis]|uniref:TetR/AcrR family transcriptional regulator n=1 Tax=Nocardia inohanensis TaxID=209246 RepID=UPI0008303CFD|nr:TetR/AcrR family transcriptional regulator [Nocardia inohanensis]
MKSGCAVCGGELAARERGRRRRYCSRSCQARAYRARLRAAPPRRRVRPERLTTVGIVRAAIELADREGLEGLSMRRLATELGVATAGLYRRFPDRDALLAEMAEYTLAEGVPVAADGWRERLTAEAHAEWQLYQRHPWMLPVLAQTRPPIGPALLDTLERIFVTLDRPGMTRETMMSIYLAMSGLVQGLALLPSSERAPVGAGAGNPVELVGPDTHPTLARHLTAADANGLNLDFDQLLADGIELLLDGVAARYFPAAGGR